MFNKRAGAQFNYHEAGQLNLPLAKQFILPEAITHGEFSQQPPLHLSTSQLVECP